MSLIEQVRGAKNYSEALSAIIAHFHADSGTIHMLESDGVLHLKAASDGLPEVVLAAVRLVPVGKGMAGLAFERGEPVSKCNIQTATGGDVQPGARVTGMEGALVVPVLHGEKPVGALGIANRVTREFSADETALLIDAGRAVAAMAKAATL
jgi:signal transduction protein with GAF and PtsI domain